MDARDLKVGAIFRADETSLRIPVYQRSYVWEQENWEHLWWDIEEKALLRSQNDPKIHFTGAIVLQPHHIVRNRMEVIDGQQRLTTFQIILCAIRNIGRNYPMRSGIISLSDAAKGYIMHEKFKTTGDPDEIFRLLPTVDSTDKTAYMNVVSGEIPGHLHDQTKLHRIYEAYNYFHEQINVNINRDMGDQEEQYEKLTCLFESIVDDFKVVRIILDDPKDEAEKIFESINGRGRALRDFDHLRNNLFLRAGDERSELYNTYWRHFDKEYILEFGTQ